MNLSMPCPDRLGLLPASWSHNDCSLKVYLPSTIHPIANLNHAKRSDIFTSCCFFSPVPVYPGRLPAPCHGCSLWPLGFTVSGAVPRVSCLTTPSGWARHGLVCLLDATIAQQQKHCPNARELGGGKFPASRVLPAFGPFPSLDCLDTPTPARIQTRHWVAG
jgi:hypothetical protein